MHFTYNPTINSNYTIDADKLNSVTFSKSFYKEQPVDNLYTIIYTAVKNALKDKQTEDNEDYTWEYGIL
jgi:hypothetical protein